MANPNTPMGLRAVRYISGKPFNGQVRRYCIAPTDTNAFYAGDPVVKVAGAADANGTPCVTLGVAGGPWTGVLAGFSPTIALVTNLGNAYRPGVQAGYVYIDVADDPDLEFEMQENDAGGTPLPVTAVGKNANGIAGTGSRYTGLSGWQLDSSTVATTNTLALSIVEFQRRADNVPGAAYGKVIVRINNHTETPHQAGI